VGAAALPLGLAAGAGAAGWLVGTAAEPSVPLALAAALVAATVAGAGLLALRGAELRDAVRLLAPQR